jgi:hypothetical protein
MQNDKQLEIEYIINKVSEQVNVENQKWYKLNIGDKVPFSESTHTMK